MRWLLLVSALVVPGIADAHIHLTNPLSRIDTLAGTDQKVEPCGVAGQQRTSRVTTYKPGQTITVTWLETIDHPGWFRIAFQPNGAGFSLPPPENGNAGDGTPSTYPVTSQEGMTLADGSMILKDRILDGTLSAEITLPNIECSNCTLQFTQFMTNNKPYTIPQTNDVYFNCADIVLAADAPDAGPTGGGDVDAGTGSNASTGELNGGCSTGGSTTGLAVSLALLGLVGVRRRRR